MDVLLEDIFMQQRKRVSLTVHNQDLNQLYFWSGKKQLAGTDKD